VNTLFSSAELEKEAPRPLADRLRPQRLSEIIGQEALVAPGAILPRMIETGKLSSLILWGPPGVGKTTIARLLLEELKLQFSKRNTKSSAENSYHVPAFEQLSAIFSGVADLRKVFDRAQQRRQTGVSTLLFVDEIHRFNRAQQDGFLPHMESGLITLVGATTENPSFELNPALLSRAQVLTLNRLDYHALDALLERAESYQQKALNLDAPARKALIEMADGDGRYLLNMAEEIFLHRDEDGPLIDRESLSEIVQKRVPLYDKSQEGHYNLASALQKSVRGSDVDAALYWAARMLEGGEDPRFLLRRLIVMASEDIGNADPHALPLAIAARDAYELIGQPEGEIAIGQLVAYLATAPKSNRSYEAFKKAKSVAKQSGSLKPPSFAMNAPTRLMKELGYSKGYIYDHDTPEGFAGQNYFPPELERTEFYRPRKTGHEREIEKRLAWWRKKRQEKTS